MTNSAIRSYGGVSAPERRAERRARLLAAARTIWGESGITAVTVRGVCKAAGLTDRYFYEHFANREELLLAVADEVRDHMLSVMVTAGLATDGPAEQKLRAALRAFLETIAADGHIHRIVSTTDPGDLPALTQRRHDVLTMIADLVVDHAPAALGVTAEPDWLRRAALFITGGVNQLIEGWLRNTIDMTAPELAAECARMCLSVIENTRP
ncbi:TetR/AcrR family transcriptional regulator [Nocardia sp. CDC159]|uniref:TetR/AcrR family transcriptional regulator n=1 Tax=Nocardia pulmonis TaxID=2951408 RepID=A0A9X2J0B0_9NOCA|nr:MULTISPECIES: TetR/AcrR family transcriptional regulator [Nocardia]MCM6778987.1 TetR/AcrR family transcriptional regulator [Nocardia pulmonis]MCM6791874.1 TetR/AcrR family transcriptional regulator [Nocardia sp. CDC159]